VTSELAAGRPANALDLIGRHGDKVQHDPVFDLALRIVAASAQAQGGNAGSRHSAADTGTADRHLTNFVAN
jgi:hypothetical protein